VAYSSELGNESFGSIKGGKFLPHFNDSELDKKDSASSSYLVKISCKTILFIFSSYNFIMLLILYRNVNSFMNFPSVYYLLLCKPTRVYFRPFKIPPCRCSFI
jgi:hypothetical protein